MLLQQLSVFYQKVHHFLNLDLQSNEHFSSSGSRFYLYQITWSIAYLLAYRDWLNEMIKILSYISLSINNNQMQEQKDLQRVTERFYINRTRRLGKGCYGEVYEGYDQEKQRKIAIKHLNKPENFQDQIQTLEKLSSLVHPNIMGFYGWQVKGDDVYLFVQFCPGGVLTDLIKKGLTQEETLDLIRQLIEGMCYMNAKGRMHRDLKPDNVLIGYREDIKISDFGLARQYGLDVTGQMGTPLYAGPEVYTNFTESYNQNCDVWSAGLILHEMLTGKHPLQHVKDIKGLKEEWKLYEKGEKRITYGSNFHPQWEYITNIMLTHNFKKRPTFHDVLEILKKVDDHGDMRRQLRNMRMGLKVEQNTRQALVENYLNFIDQKADVLTCLSDYLIEQDYPYMRKGLKYLLVFLATARYVSKMKKFARSLKFKTVKLPDGEQLIQRGSKDNNILLLVEKYRNSVETKNTKYLNQLKQTIIPRLCQQQANSQEDRQIFKSVESSFKLVLEMKDGTMDVQENYAQEYSKLVNFHKIKPTDEKVKNMTMEHLEIYLRVLLCGFLDEEFPDKMFGERDFVLRKLKQLSLVNPQALVDTTNKLRKRLH